PRLTAGRTRASSLDRGCRPWISGVHRGSPRRCSPPMGEGRMTATSFDFTPLLPAGSPAPAVKWTGAPRYNFTGGNNDPRQVPPEGLMAAADAVLRREGRTLATYGLASGPQGYRPLREFLAARLAHYAGISCTFDDILIVSGSLQALDLVNGALLARGDTVI